MIIGFAHTVQDNSTTLHPVIYLLSPVRNFLSAHLQAGRRQTGDDLWTLSCMDKRLHGLLSEVTWFSITRGSNTHQGPGDIVQMSHSFTFL